MDTREPTGATATMPAPETSAAPSPGAAGVKDEAKSLLDEAKQETSRLAGAARERAAQAASSKKEAAAEKIDTVAEVLHDAGQRLREETGLGRYAERAAEQVDHLARYLRRSDWSGMVRDAETFARRHPELFLGVAFLAGMAAARLLKSAPPAAAPQPMETA